MAVLDVLSKMVPQPSKGVELRAGGGQGGPKWLPKSPTSTIEGMGSLPLASGAPGIKLCNSFTVRDN